MKTQKFTSLQLKKCVAEHVVNSLHTAHDFKSVLRVVVGNLTFFHRHISHKHELPVTLGQRHAEAVETDGETVKDSDLISAPYSMPCCPLEASWMKLKNYRTSKDDSFIFCTNIQ